MQQLVKYGETYYAKQHKCGSLLDIYSEIPINELHRPNFRGCYNKSNFISIAKLREQRINSILN